MFYGKVKGRRAIEGKIRTQKRIVSDYCAVRELSEETGYSAERIVDFGKIYPSPGYLSEIVYIFFAKNVKKTGDAHTDEDEYLSLVKMPLDEAQRLIEEGRHFYDAKTIIAITKYLLMRDRLN